jgi:hypothetical protein
MVPARSMRAAGRPFQSSPSGRSADRLLGGFRERAANQGYAHRDEVSHARRRGGFRALSKAIVQTTPGSLSAGFACELVDKELRLVRNAQPRLRILGHPRHALCGLDMWLGTFGLGCRGR